MLTTGSFRLLLVALGCLAHQALVSSAHVPSMEADSSREALASKARPEAGAAEEQGPREEPRQAGASGAPPAVCLVAVVPSREGAPSVEAYLVVRRAEGHRTGAGEPHPPGAGERHQLAPEGRPLLLVPRGWTERV